MKKIAILRCLRSNDVCTGSACLKALAHKSGSFTLYEHEQVELVAFWSCNGCEEVSLDNDKGLPEKIACIKKLQPDAVHVGICTKKINKNGELVVCEAIKNITKELQAAGINVVFGTH